MAELESIRTTLARVDRERALERAAESARGRIRLSGTPVARKGLLGFLRSDKAFQDSFFTKDETAAIYEALAVVREDCRMRAAQLEASIGDPS